MLNKLSHGLRQLLRTYRARLFPGSERYWEKRYASGGHSGAGSYDRFARFKSEIINTFIDRNKITTVIEFGCGDGNQLSLAQYPRYLGFDVSKTAINSCKECFSNDNSKTFKLMTDYNGETADLALSLDVIYHLVEDEVFEQYMQNLFKAGEQYVIIYSSNFNDDDNYQGRHVRHREFTNWVHDNAPQWDLVAHIPNRYPYTGNDRIGSFADFYIYGNSQG